MRTRLSRSLSPLAADSLAGRRSCLPPRSPRSTGPPASASASGCRFAQIHDKLQAAGYRNIEKIERERGGYEVRATDRNGERVKLLRQPADRQRS